MSLSEKHVLVLSFRNSSQILLGMLRSISEQGIAFKATPLSIARVVLFVNEINADSSSAAKSVTNEVLGWDIPVVPAVVSTELVAVAETFSSVIREIEILIQAGKQLIVGLSGQIPVVDYALITAAHRYASVRYTFSFHMSEDYAASTLGSEIANALPSRTNRRLLLIPTYERYEYRGTLISPRDKIFFCYSDRDAKFVRDEFLCHFTTLLYDNIVIDRNHSSNIEEAIRETRVAVLFVTPDFLEDSYIQEIIEPIVMREVQRKNILLLWLVLTPVVEKNVEKLAKYKPLNDLKRPYNSFRKSRRQLEAVRISEAIQSAYYD